MNLLESNLFRTRHSVLEVCELFNIPYPPLEEITLISCSSCGVWLKTMKKDQDDLDICNLCLDTYGS
jgi:hypothetical protein